MLATGTAFDFSTQLLPALAERPSSRAAASALSAIHAASAGILVPAGTGLHAGPRRALRAARAGLRGGVGGRERDERGETQAQDGVSPAVARDRGGHRVLSVPAGRSSRRPSVRRRAPPPPC